MNQERREAREIGDSLEQQVHRAKEGSKVCVACVMVTCPVRSNSDIYTCVWDGLTFSVEYIMHQPQP